MLTGQVDLKVGAVDGESDRDLGREPFSYAAWRSPAVGYLVIIIIEGVPDANLLVRELSLARDSETMLGAAELTRSHVLGVLAEQGAGRRMSSRRTGRGLYFSASLGRFGPVAWGRPSPMEVSRDQFEVFEQMHYVCFHYEFA